jgi:hypothetical protein
MTSVRQTLPGSWRSPQGRQFILITIVAIAIYGTMRLLPTGTNLNHADFRVAGGNSIEFCDPTNPQFIPVVAVRSPVTLTLVTATAPIAGHEVHATATLRTSSGKPIAPEDLLVVHTKLMHLLMVDPTLTDYQHIHPSPTKTPGEWTFSFTPRLNGMYRVFADFTPVATGRGLYANADLEIAGNVTAVSGTAVSLSDGRPKLGETAERSGYRYTLRANGGRIRVRQPVDLTFDIRAADGTRVPLQPVMGAFAHLVAFDAQRSGFAHLHPAQADPLTPPDPVQPTLKFKLTIPTAGQYVIWTQINLAGHEVFVPFWFDVAE